MSNVLVIGGQGTRTIPVRSVEGLATLLAANPTLRDLKKVPDFRIDNAPAEIAQPLLVAYHLARARPFLARGCVRGVVGQSLGEISAAAIAGCLSANTALELARLRARLPRELLTGTWCMAALVGTPIWSIQQAANPGCEIACVNSPEDVILSGRCNAVQGVINYLDISPNRHRFLPVSYPYHTSFMAPVAEALACELNRMDLNEAQVPWFSPTAMRIVSDPHDAAHVFTQMLTHALDWRAALRHVAQLWPVEQFIDCSPSSTLARFLHKNSIDIRWTSLEV